MRMSLKESVMPPKKDVTRSVRMDEQTDDFFVRAAGQVDCSVSEFIRDAAMLGAPLLRSMPGLLGRVTLDAMDKTTSCG